MSVQIELNGVQDVAKFLSNVSDQIPFAAAKALNETAKREQKMVTEELLPSKFTLRARGNPWQTPRTKFGMNIKFARKDTLEAAMGSQADWLKLQETGGTKSIPGKQIAIAVDARPNPNEPIPRSLKPAQLKAKGVSFVIKFKSGKTAVFARVGRGRGTLKLMYFLTPTGQIKPRLSFDKTTAPPAPAWYAEEFASAFAQALITAR